MSDYYPRTIAGSFERAMEFAIRAHRGQTRKDGCTPYVVHPISVARLVYCDMGIEDADVIQAALLHDVLEDTGVSEQDLRDRFGPKVTDMVKALTLPQEINAPGKHREKLEHVLKMFETASVDRIAIKIADRLDNLRDYETLVRRGLRERDLMQGIARSSYEIAKAAQERLRPSGMLMREFQSEHPKAFRVFQVAGSLGRLALENWPIG